LSVEPRGRALTGGGPFAKLTRVASARKLPLASSGPSAELVGAPGHGAEPAAAEASRLEPSRLERCEPGDRFADYVLEPYAPRAPFVGKLRSVSLFYAALAEAGVAREGEQLVERVRALLGPFRTVWGVKVEGSPPRVAGFELYFYDRARAHADLSIARVTGGLSPLLTLDAEEPRPLPWHMFSVAFTPEALATGGRASLHVYLDMRSYELVGREPVLENIYTFHDPARDVDEVLHRLRSSIHVDARGPLLGKLLPPYLVRCGTVCVANKRASDAVYFSRVETPAVLELFARHAWPARLSRLLAEHAPSLDHLLWCVGVDVRGGPSGLEVRKSGVYGSF
jgi:hypothetical protein